MSTRERRPTEEAPPETPTRKSAPSLPLDTARRFDLATAFVVIVVTPRGKYTRRVYLSLHSASLAVGRAHDRGQPASMTLCRIVPADGDL